MDKSSDGQQRLCLQQSFSTLHQLTFSDCTSDLPLGLFSKPLQRKLDTLLRCNFNDTVSPLTLMQLTLSVAHRAVDDLTLHHQAQHHATVNIWAAIRSHGCQFLGPAMQEDVLKLILLSLEDGSCLSRKVLVLFVVQRLQLHYPQASKTAVGHVVQLLYRASCFHVIKRDEESSLMQLKEEFQNYESLRCQHDTQIVEISLEFGLRIPPEQWSCLLYGDTSRRSHMQSIVDKLSKKRTFPQSTDDLLIILKKSLKTPEILTELKPHLDLLVSFQQNSTLTADSTASWTDVDSCLDAVIHLLTSLTSLLQQRPVHRSGNTFTPRSPSRRCNGEVHRTKDCHTVDADFSKNSLGQNFVEPSHETNDLRTMTELESQSKIQSFSDISSRTDKDIEHPEVLRSHDLAGAYAEHQAEAALGDGTPMCSCSPTEIFSNVSYSIAAVSSGISVPQLNLFASSCSIPCGLYPQLQQQQFIALPVHAVPDAKVSSSIPTGNFSPLLPLHSVLPSSGCLQQPLCFPAVDEFGCSVPF